MKRFLFITITIVALAGCTEAQRGKLYSLGDQARVTCYSGGTMIYDGVSTGKVSSEDSSDGYYFRDSETGKMKEVSGDCNITYNPDGTE